MGNPEADKVTGTVVPEVRVRLIDWVTEDAWVRVLAGILPILKLKLLTVRLKLVSLVIVPEVLVTVTVLTLEGVLERAVIVMVVAQFELQDMGLKLAVTPDGNPEAVNKTDCCGPAFKVKLIVWSTDEPEITVLSPPLVRVKSDWAGIGTTTSGPTSVHFCKVSDRRFLKSTRYLGWLLMVSAAVVEFRPCRSLQKMMCEEELTVSGLMEIKLPFMIRAGAVVTEFEAQVMAVPPDTVEAV